MAQPKHLENNELEELARKRMDTYATAAHRQLADQVREQHPLHEPPDLPQDMEITPDLTGGEDDTSNQNIDTPSVMNISQIGQSEQTDCQTSIRIQ